MKLSSNILISINIATFIGLGIWIIWKFELLPENANIIIGFMAASAALLGVFINQLYQHKNLQKQLKHSLQLQKNELTNDQKEKKIDEFKIAQKEFFLHIGKTSNILEQLFQASRSFNMMNIDYLYYQQKYLEHPNNDFFMKQRDYFDESAEKKHKNMISLRQQLEEHITITTFHITFNNVADQNSYHDYIISIYNVLDKINNLSKDNDLITNSFHNKVTINRQSILDELIDMSETIMNLLNVDFMKYRDSLLLSMDKDSHIF